MAKKIKYPPLPIKAVPGRIVFRTKQLGVFTVTCPMAPLMEVEIVDATAADIEELASRGMKIGDWVSVMSGPGVTGQWFERFGYITAPIDRIGTIITAYAPPPPKEKKGFPFFKKKVKK